MGLYVQNFEATSQATISKNCAQLGYPTKTPFTPIRSTQVFFLIQRLKTDKGVRTLYNLKVRNKTQRWVGKLGKILVLHNFVNVLCGKHLVL